MSAALAAALAWERDVRFVTHAQEEVFREHPAFISACQYGPGKTPLHSCEIGSVYGERIVVRG